MAQRGIREYDGKRILAEHWKEYFSPEFEYEFRSVLVTPETDLEKLPEKYPWLNEVPLVAKPDMLFGKRGKLGLILFKKEKPCDVDYEAVKEWTHIPHFQKNLNLTAVTNKLPTQTTGETPCLCSTFASIYLA
jgi:succinyl-CoA synthetase beta subunit